MHHSYLKNAIQILVLELHILIISLYLNSKYKILWPPFMLEGGARAVAKTTLNLRFKQIKAEIKTIYYKFIPVRIN